jgi:hypothetical protein
MARKLGSTTRLLTKNIMSMRKVLATAAVVLSLIACGGGNDSETNSDTSATTMGDTVGTGTGSGGGISTDTGTGTINPTDTSNRISDTSARRSDTLR